MKKNQRIMTASVTVIAAAVTAHLMQRSSGDVTNLIAVAPAQAGIAAAPGPDPALALNPVTVMAKPTTTMAELAGEPAKDLSEVNFVAAVATPDVQESQTAGAYPDMPRPPMDALMPAPLPRLGQDLQTRMASVALPVAESAEPATPMQETPIVKPEPEVQRNEFGLSCGALLTASPKDAAMVGLTLTDPCRGNEVFTLTHGPLTFTARLNQLGTHMVDIPALTDAAVFNVTLSDGTKVETEVTVPMADQIDRVALFTKAQSGLEIHALEFGADYEQSGHIWSGNARDAQSAAKAGGGFVTVLGDDSLPDAQLVQVYTFPANTKHREGVVRLSVETEVTTFNCGKDIAGQTLQIEAGQNAAPVSLTLAMPGCDAIGEFLVLKNLLRDLKIASN